jgi:hypothetical protein
MARTMLPIRRRPLSTTLPLNMRPLESTGHTCDDTASFSHPTPIVAAETATSAARTTSLQIPADDLGSSADIVALMKPRQKHHQLVLVMVASLHCVAMPDLPATNVHQHG